MLLLDTNACIKVLNGSSAPLVARLRNHAPSELRVSSVTRAELLYGARRSARVAENLRLLAAFFAPLVSVPFDDACAEQVQARFGHRSPVPGARSGRTTCSSPRRPSRTT